MRYYVVSVIISLGITAEVITIYSNFRSVTEDDTRCSACSEQLLSANVNSIVSCLELVPPECQYSLTATVAGESNLFCENTREIALQDIITTLPDPIIESIEGSVELQLTLQASNVSCAFDVYNYGGLSCRTEVDGSALTTVDFYEGKAILSLELMKDLNVHFFLISLNTDDCTGMMGPFTYPDNTTAHLSLYGLGESSIPPPQPEGIALETHSVTLLLLLCLTSLWLPKDL